MASTKRDPPDLYNHSSIPLPKEPPPPYSEHYIAENSVAPAPFSLPSSSTPLLPNTGDYGGYDTLPTAPPLEQVPPSHPSFFQYPHYSVAYYFNPTANPRGTIIGRRTSITSSIFSASTNSENVLEDSCYAPLADPLSWTCLIYLIVAAPLITLLCFIWVLVTPIIGLASLLIPPFTVPVITAILYSYRLLGHFELLTQKLACGSASPPSRSMRYVLPPVFPDLPVFPPTDNVVTGSKPNLKQLISQKFTYHSFFYLLIIKPVLVLVMFVVAFTAVSVAMPMALCLLPAACLLCRTIGVQQKNFAFSFLADVKDRELASDLEQGQEHPRIDRGIGICGTN